MKQRSYIFVGPPPEHMTARTFEFNARERDELAAQYGSLSQHAFDRIVHLCLQAGYPRFTMSELEARRGPRIALTV